MEVLKPIYASEALIGFHITRPFHYIILDPETNYTTLLDVFKKTSSSADNHQDRIFNYKKTCLQVLNKWSI